MTVTVYGIKACDTMKKAFSWLDQQGIAYQFHDYKKAGIEPQRVHDWIEALGWEQVINRRGTSWRKLPESQRDQMDAAAAAEAAVANPSLIRRPLVEVDGRPLLLGFQPDDWSRVLGR